MNNSINFALVDLQVLHKLTSMHCAAIVKIFDEKAPKGAERSVDLKILKSAPLSLNHHNFSNTEPILLNYLAGERKTKMVDLLPWQQQITDSQTYNSVKSILMGK